MMDLRDKRVLVAGLGKTGQSVLPVLRRLGAQVSAADTRRDLADLDALRAQYPEVRFQLGPFDVAQFLTQDLIVASPGLAQNDYVFAQTRWAGVPVVGDVELFFWLCRAPVVGITGSNGKSTVTTLVGEMASAAGVSVRVGGNLGTPALSLLDPAAALYVLELSSFQLELVDSFRPRVAAILNLSEDHMDRYSCFNDYVLAKARLFARMGAGDTLVLNAHDEAVRDLADQVPATAQCRYFGRKAPQGAGNARVCPGATGAEHLCLDSDDGSQPWMSVADLQIVGEHNIENAMAALAIAHAAGIPRDAAVQVLANFTGLPHRMAKVSEIGGVRYYDDSKGTNVGATVRAIDGLPGPVIPILGGDGKQQDFSPLRAAVLAKARAVLLIGRDAPLIELVLKDTVPLHHASSLPEAVRLASELAQPGDQVLLSPACASFDMFRDYAERGQVFVDSVQALQQEVLT